MESLEERIGKIILNNFPGWHNLKTTSELYHYSENTAKEIADHIKEFIEWTLNNCEVSGGSIICGKRWYVYKLAADNEDCFLTTEKLYTYWLTQIKGK